MDILTVQGLLAMLQIIVIDILLAGDNAIVIGMAARNLPAHLQKKAIFWGTAGAIILRLVMAFLFVEALNNIPALRLVGGILLLWIGYKLVADDEASIISRLKIIYVLLSRQLSLRTVSWASIMLSA